jgi:hypothetical protein
MAEQAQHQPAHRVRGSPAVVVDLGPRGVVRDGDVLAERGQQRLEQVHRQAPFADGVPEGQEDGVGGRWHRSRRHVRAAGRWQVAGIRRTDGGVQAHQPVVEQAQALARRVAVFVGEVVGRARERVDGGDVRADRRRHEA